ncbi:MAG: hypothetical protein IKU43_02145 [Clostridia bacterium]|nr:hypothetical protein [Clostridia bacterium]
MHAIDELIKMLYAVNPQEIQNEGIRLAREVEHIAVFILPPDSGAWENCAKILAERDDKTLKPYLIDIFEWLMDMTYPGAFIIYDRLLRYEKNQHFFWCVEMCTKYAKVINEYPWYHNMISLIGGKDEWDKL